MKQKKKPTKSKSSWCCFIISNTIVETFESQRLGSNHCSLIDSCVAMGTWLISLRLSFLICRIEIWMSISQQLWRWNWIININEFGTCPSSCHSNDLLDLIFRMSTLPKWKILFNIAFLCNPGISILGIHSGY